MRSYTTNLGEVLILEKKKDTESQGKVRKDNRRNGTQMRGLARFRTKSKGHKAVALRSPGGGRMFSARQCSYSSQSLSGKWTRQEVARGMEHERKKKNYIYEVRYIRWRTGVDVRKKMSTSRLIFRHHDRCVVQMAKTPPESLIFQPLLQREDTTNLHG